MARGYVRARTYDRHGASMRRLACDTSRPALCAPAGARRAATPGNRSPSSRTSTVGGRSSPASRRARSGRARPRVHAPRVPRRLELLARRLAARARHGRRGRDLRPRDLHRRRQDDAVAAHIPAPTAVEAVAWLRPRRIVGGPPGRRDPGRRPGDGRGRPTPRLPLYTYDPAVARTSAGLAVLIRSTPRTTDGGRRARRRAQRRADGHRAERARWPPTRAAGARSCSARDEPVAEVDLRTMTVRYHRVPVPRTARRRLEALWLGDGMAGRLRRLRARRHVIDTEHLDRRGRWRRAATSARLAAGRLLVYSRAFGPVQGRRSARVHARRAAAGAASVRRPEAGRRGRWAPTWRCSGRDAGRTRATRIVRARIGRAHPDGRAAAARIRGDHPRLAARQRQRCRAERRLRREHRDVIEAVTVSGSGSAARPSATDRSSTCHALGPMRTSCVDSSRVRNIACSIVRRR